MKNIVMMLGAGILLFSSANGFAAGFSLGIEPIVGYERVQKVLPTPHTKNRMMYGARVSAGIPLLALEASYTRGTDSESYPTQSLDTKDTDDKVKLGLRSSLRMTSLMSFNLRAGAQGKRNTHEETLNGATTRTVGNFIYKPYGGAGLTSRLMNNISVDVGVTAIFNDFPHMEKNEYETTAGFSVKFP